MSWRRLVDWLGAEEAGTSVALFRIAMALCVVWTVGLTMWTGTLAMVWLPIEHGGYRSLGDGSWQVAMLGGPTPVVVWGLAWTAVAASLLLMVGVGGAVLSRVLAFVAMQSFLGVADLNSHAGGSYDELIANGLWLLVLGGPARTLSVETWRATGRWWTPERTVPRWPRLLMVYQAILMYATTGWQKLSVHWMPGGDLSALYYILQQPTWQLRDNSWVAWVYPLTQLGTLVSWVWEVTAPVWLLAFVLSWDGVRREGWRWWVAQSRWVYFAVGVFFHLAVHAMMNIGPFSWASLAYYAALVHPFEWAAVRERLRGLVGRGGRSP